MRIKLELMDTSWDNLFHCLRKSDAKISSEGNFWAAIQELERQLDSCVTQNKENISDTTNLNQMDLFNE
jgi:hypothetical protein